jgi:hypothetical protein
VNEGEVTAHCGWPVLPLTHSLPNALTDHEPSKSWFPAWAVVAAASPTLNKPTINSLLMNDISLDLRSGDGRALEERDPIIFTSNFGPFAGLNAHAVRRDRQTGAGNQAFSRGKG